MTDTAPTTFRTWRLITKRHDPVARATGSEPVGWLATDGARTFGLVDGDTEWTEDAELIGYPLGFIDDGTIATPAPLPDGLPNLPIGPNADTAATVAAPTADDGMADGVGVMMRHNMARLAEGWTADEVAVATTPTAPTT